MKIRILMITYNRPHYTARSLERLCKTAPANARITVWDNASGKETIDVLKRFERHPRVEKVVYSASNEKLRAPTNWFWENSKDADLLSKVDDDCLMSPGWCERLEAAHKDIQDAGALGCWRFLPEDFNLGSASKKIHVYGRHMVLRNCWVEGSGYLMKRKVVDMLGPLRPSESYPGYLIRAAAKGFINGWYYPFIYQEHMDDPRAEHTGIKTDEDFRRLIPLSAREFGIKSRDEWTERLRRSAQKLQLYSIDPYDFIGIRAKIKKKLHSMLGMDYFPKV